MSQFFPPNEISPRKAVQKYFFENFFFKQFSKFRVRKLPEQRIEVSVIFEILLNYKGIHCLRLLRWRKFSSDFRLLRNKLFTRTFLRMVDLLGTYNGIVNFPKIRRETKLVLLKDTHRISFQSPSNNAVRRTREDC